MIQIKKYKTTNCYKNRKGKTPDMYVLHNTGSTSISSAHYWFINPTSLTAANFLVGLDGEIRQYGEITDGCYCNGTSTDPKKHTYYKNARNRIVQSRSDNANLYTISIECVGKCGDKLTDAQMQAVVSLIEYCNAEVKKIYGTEIPMDADHIARHCDLNPKNKATCGVNILAKDVLAAMNKTVIDDVAPAIEKGDLVSIREGATYYNGKAIPNFVKSLKWYVKVASKTSDRVVIDKSEDGRYSICSAIHRKYLKEEVPDVIAKGSLVSLTNDAKYWNGKVVPTWVKNQRWYVSSAPENSDRYVINKSEDGKSAICSPIHKKYLVKEK